MKQVAQIELLGAHRVEAHSDGGRWLVESVDDGRDLRVIASWGAGWDHVSISRVDRIPTWREMEQTKRLFFRDNETAMQLHVPPVDHINNNPHVLHLWRPHKGAIPRPPRFMV